MDAVIKVEDVERRAEGVGVDAVRRDDDGRASAGHRPAGEQIDDVRAADAVDGSAARQTIAVTKASIDRTDMFQHTPSAGYASAPQERANERTQFALVVRRFQPQ